MTIKLHVGLAIEIEGKVTELTSSRKVVAFDIDNDGALFNVHKFSFGFADALFQHVTHAVITKGNLRLVCDLNLSKAFNFGDQIVFAIGKMKVSIGV